MHEPEVGLPIDGFQEAHALEFGDRRFEFDAQRLLGLEAVMVVQLDFSERVPGEIAQDGHDAGVALFTRVKPRMLGRPAVAVAMPRGQSAVAAAPPPDARLIVRRFKMIDEQEEHMNGRLW